MRGTWKPGEGRLWAAADVGAVPAALGVGVGDATAHAACGLCDSDTQQFPRRPSLQLLGRGQAGRLLARFRSEPQGWGQCRGPSPAQVSPAHLPWPGCWCVPLFLTRRHALRAHSTHGTCGVHRKASDFPQTPVRPLPTSTRIRDTWGAQAHPAFPVFLPKWVPRRFISCRCHFSVSNRKSEKCLPVIALKRMPFLCANNTPGDPGGLQPPAFARLPLSAPVTQIGTGQMRVFSRFILSTGLITVRSLVWGEEGVLSIYLVNFYGRHLCESSPWKWG